MPGSNVKFKQFNIQIGYHTAVKGPHRHLWISPDSSDDTPVAGIFVLFMDDHGAESNIGYYNPGNDWVVGFALNRDFDSVSRHLSSAKDLLFRWYADEVSNQIVWFQIAGDYANSVAFVTEGEKLLRGAKLPTLGGNALSEDVRS